MGSIAANGVGSSGREIEIDVIQKAQGNSFARQQLVSQAASEPPLGKLTHEHSTFVESHDG